MFFIIVILLLFTSCVKQELGSESFLSGTEWIAVDGDTSIGLKFYNSNEVSFFVSSGAAVNTAYGTYEYLSSIKKISFNGVYFYDRTTYQHLLELKGGQIIDKNTMKISYWYNINNESGIEEECLYKK